VARLRLGRLEDARADLGKRTATAARPAGAADGASVELASAERERRAERRRGTSLRSARREALSAPGSRRRRRRGAAASLLLAQDARCRAGTSRSRCVGGRGAVEGAAAGAGVRGGAGSPSRARFLKAELRAIGADGRGTGSSRWRRGRGAEAVA